MKFTEEPRYEFFPKLNGNLELPENERLTVEIIRPTGYQRKEFTSVIITREYYPDDQPVDTDGNPRTVKKFKKITGETKVNADYILRNCVGCIKNLTVVVTDKDGKKVEREITNGAELAECRAYGIADLISEICIEVQSDEITDAKKKITA